MIGLVALDEILWLLLGSVSFVALEGNLLGHLFLNRSPDPARFRVPFNVIAAFETARHGYNLQKGL
jgi:hypothetical protein